MVLIYAFSNPWGTNVSRLVLSELEKHLTGVDFKPVNTFPHPFFHKYIENNIYDLIIGLGDGGKFLSKIKIETQAKNSYNYRPIHPFYPILVDLNLPNVDNFDSKYFSIGDNMGTYKCNYLAFETQISLNQRKLDTKHLFLHLPPRANANILATNIYKLITDNHLI